MNTTWYLHSHFAWLRLSYSSIVKLPFVCVVAHESGVSSMDDRRICHTSTASPAEPGDLSWRLGRLGRLIEMLQHLLGQAGRRSAAKFAESETAAVVAVAGAL